MDSVISTLSLQARKSLRDMIPYIDNDPTRKDLAAAYLNDWEAWAEAAESQRVLSDWGKNLIFLIIPPLLIVLYMVLVGSKELDKLFAKVQASQKAYYDYVRVNGGSAIEKELLRRLNTENYK